MIAMGANACPAPSFKDRACFWTRPSVMAVMTFHDHATFSAVETVATFSAAEQLEDCAWLLRSLSLLSAVGQLGVRSASLSSEAVRGVSAKKRILC